MHTYDYVDKESTARSLSSNSSQIVRKGSMFKILMKSKAAWDHECYVYTAILMSGLELSTMQNFFI
jgi:hypothetical protein